MRQPVHVAKVRGEVFTHFHAFAAKRQSSMRKLLFGLLGRILCQKSTMNKLGVRVPVGPEFSLLHIVQTGSRVHPVSYPVGTGGSFPGVKRQGRESCD
jgi:hypothetical protein